MRTAVDRWYSNSRWAKRARRQIEQHPLCVFCLKDGIVTPATVADHITPHKGDYNSFWYGKLQSLCAAHHNATKQMLEKRGYVTDIGVDGFPTDRKHPFYQRD